MTCRNEEGLRSYYDNLCEARELCEYDYDYAVELLGDELVECIEEAASVNGMTEKQLERWDDTAHDLASAVLNDDYEEIGRIINDYAKPYLIKCMEQRL